MQLLLTDREPEPEPEPAETYTCADCASESETEFDYRNASGEPICESCADNYCPCENCDETVRNDDTVSVRSRRASLTWCEPCLRSDGFRCDDCGKNFIESLALGRNTDDNTVCESCADNYFYCDGCNTTCHQNEYGEDGCCESCSRRDSDDIPEYHSEARPWRNRTIPALALGVELECYSANRADVAEIATDCGMIAEQDGSLDDTCGIEIVGSPMKMSEYGASNCPWKSFLSQARVKAWDAGTGYGMHVSLNTAGMLAMDVAKFILFIHSNKSLCETIAGRSESSWAEYKDKNLKSMTQDIRAGRESQKYEAAAIRSKTRVEVRIFRATAKFESFLKNVQFVDAVRAFTQSASPHSLTEKAFLAWLAGRLDYRELRAFLWKKKLLCAPLNFTVKNTQQEAA